MFFPRRNPRQPEDGERELSKEEEQHGNAEAAVQAAEARAKQAGEKLEAAMVTMEQKYVHYQPYWVEGLGTTAEAVLAAAEAGVPLRGAIWAHVAPGSKPAGEGEPPPAPPAEGAGEGLDTPPPPPIPAPELWAALKEAARTAGWDDVAGRLVALEIELPHVPVPPPVDEDPKAKKSAKKPDPKKKGAAEEPTPPPTPPQDTPGWDRLAALLAGLCRRVRSYEEWRRTVTVYDATAPEPAVPMSYYNALVGTVPEERVSVPVLLHAMLEQVARNAQGEEASAEIEDAMAQSWALAALDGALSGLHVDDEGDSKGKGAIFKPSASTQSGYTMVIEGDALAAAATGLTTGYVRPATMGSGASCNSNSATSPTSVLEGTKLGAGPGSMAGSGNAQEGEPPPPTVGMGLPLFVPGTSVLDVDTVEQHMVSLLSVPGAGRVDMPAEPEQDDVARALRSTALKVIAMCLEHQLYHWERPGEGGG